MHIIGNDIPVTTAFRNSLIREYFEDSWEYKKISSNPRYWLSRNFYGSLDDITSPEGKYHRFDTEVKDHPDLYLHDSPDTIDIFRIISSYRLTDEFIEDLLSEPDFPDSPYPTVEDWYGSYHICRRRKNDKPSHLKFFFDFPTEMHRLIHEEMDYRQYIQRMSICFVITYPRLREVIAADFADRIIQTQYVQEVMPYLELHFLNDYSFSCRVDKGSLKAVSELQKLIKEASEDYTRDDLWLAKIDIKNFFMSIDTDIAVERMSEFIELCMSDHPKKDFLLWLTPNMYQSKPQLYTRLNSPQRMHNGLEEGKILIWKDTPIGVAIGNVTNQMIANFITTYYLMKLKDLGYKFAHYTDDTVVLVRDLEKWKRDIKEIENFLKEELHLTLHPKKRYLQHYSKGVEFLGYKLRFGRVLPSDRIVHNIKWLVAQNIELIDTDPKKAYFEKDHFFMQLNSYFGLLRHCNSYRLMLEITGMLRDSKWSEIFDIYEYKVLVKPEKSTIEYLVRENLKRKQDNFKKWNGLYRELVMSRPVVTKQKKLSKKEIKRMAAAEWRRKKLEKSPIESG